MAATEETRTGSDWASEQAKRAMAPGAVWQSAGEFEDIRYEIADRTHISPTY